MSIFGLKKKVRKEKIPLLQEVLGNLVKDLEELKSNNYRRRSDLKELITDRVSELGAIRKNTPLESKLFNQLNKIIDPLATINSYLKGEVKLSESAIKKFVKDAEMRSLALIEDKA